MEVHVLILIDLAPELLEYAMTGIPVAVIVRSNAVEPVNVLLEIFEEVQATLVHIASLMTG